MKTVYISIGILVSFLAWYGFAPHEEVEKMDRIDQNKEIVKIEEEVEEIQLSKPFGEDIWQLTQFLEDYGSPIADEAGLIIEVSNEYNVDWKLVVAIMCTESSCGKAKINDYNLWGYGVTSSGYLTSNESWGTLEEALHTFCSSYSRNYGEYGSDIEAISRAGYNTNQSWIDTVTLFYNRI